MNGKENKDCMYCGSKEEAQTCLISCGVRMLCLQDKGNDDFEKEEVGI